MIYFVHPSLALGAVLGGSRAVTGFSADLSRRSATLLARRELSLSFVDQNSSVARVGSVVTVTIRPPGTGTGCRA